MIAQARVRLAHVDRDITGFEGRIAGARSEVFQALRAQLTQARALRQQLVDLIAQHAGGGGMRQVGAVVFADSAFEGWTPPGYRSDRYASQLQAQYITDGRIARMRESGHYVGSYADGDAPDTMTNADDPPGDSYVPITPYYGSAPVAQFPPTYYPANTAAPRTAAAAPSGAPVYVRTSYVSQSDVDSARREAQAASANARSAQSAYAAQRAQTHRADASVTEAEAIARRAWTGRKADIDLHGEEEQRYGWTGHPADRAAGMFNDKLRFMGLR